MPILPLPQFEADLKEQEAQDRKVYEALSAPKTIVVRFGSMKLIGEFPYDGSAKPGCGSKLVVRTHRGTELGEMLTSTCPNSGCSKSVSRQEVLSYVENSGGRDYPFTTEGRVLRVATKEDLDRQAGLEQGRHEMKMRAREAVERAGLAMKVVDAEPILGGERITFYFASEERIDFRDLVRELGSLFRARIDLRQVGARDEARLTADYEKCGQYCCCKNFLKVLKPVSMKSAKVQKATLDPLKISGRCGRLMCCLRYEDQTYADLQARLPRKKSRVGTPEGDGIVIDTQILTQLVLVQLDGPLEAEPKRIAVPVEELTPPRHAGGAPMMPAQVRPIDRGAGHGRGESRRSERPGDRPRPPEASKPPLPTSPVASPTPMNRPEPEGISDDPEIPEAGTPAIEGQGPVRPGGDVNDGERAGPRRSRRRRRRRRGPGSDGAGPSENRNPESGPSPA
jgi:cell fate regulator YaaT (PSP1 superfamily)